MVNPQPTRTVRGQVLRPDNTPLSGIKGFTVQAFDAISPTNIVPLGNPVALPADGKYQITYTWSSPNPSRNQPNLLVRVVSQGAIVGQASKQFAGMKETLDITVNVPPPPPPTFNLFCTVKEQTTGATRPNLRVDATFRVSNQVLLTPSSTTNADGNVSFAVDRALFNNLPSGQSITVTFQVFQGTQLLQTSSSIPNLQPEDQKFDILVTLPPKNYLVKGTIRQSNGAVLAGAIVHADNVKQGTRLGTSRTDSNGNYEIHYTLAAEASDPDLVISVYNEQGQPLAISPRRDNAKSEETIDLIVNIPEPPIVEDPLIVKGEIRQADGTPLANTLVRAVDKDMRTEQLLGEQRTNTQGYYEIRYTRSQFSRAEKQSADLIVRVFDSNNQEIQQLTATTDTNTPLETIAIKDAQGNTRDTPIWFNAPAVAIINLSIIDPRYRGLSEYERYLQELTPLLESIPLGNLEAEDIIFLAKETTINSQHITFLRDAFRLSQQTAITPPAFYGLFRQNLPTDLSFLLARDPKNGAVRSSDRSRTISFLLA